MLQAPITLISTCKAHCINSARFVWRHRTKSVGTIGMVAGGVEKFLSTHPDIHLPARGTMLIVFGGVVACVGLFNELEAFFAS